MTSPREYAQRVADALVDVIEDARWQARIGSLRDLATRAGMTHTALNKRMRHETPFNVRDLAAVAAVLDIHPAELLTRAKALVDERASLSLVPGVETDEVVEEIAAHDSEGLIADEQEATDTP
ncbi:helix-turn-helix domain-containing protein [Nocardioides lianchengensis]|uniref:HTH cro/C1-type domain-containing protein n=1 Tax=Nocardioides lianchengensis TaxID=1045774 RepID=A0A1G6LNH0_9ACTN|nr:helix-turn-helix transcriptional regulator [Nocardioides lianchengensis]NYG12495.1 transcriptional regulator with XRE-family HTH domain [Nocardioides lianchengensis]SDC44790.1 hypothetical protein SAMN05421872_102310 [Nocardioides lianchengensis]